MKRRIIHFLIISAFGAMITSCEDTFCVNGSGPIEQRELMMSTFHSVEVKTEIIVYLTQNPNATQSVEIRGQANILDELDIYVSNETLIIEGRECYNTDEELVAFIDLNQFKRLELSGSGEIIGTNIFVTNDVEIDLTGSGTIDLELLSDDIESYISGSGLLRLQGECDDHEIRIPGSGSIESFGLQSHETDVKIPGSGSVEVYVLDFLNVLITGSGSVYYKGFPDIQATITGSGSVVNSN